MRFAIRRMIRKSIKNGPREIIERLSLKILLIEDLKQQPIAIHTDTTNEQHYELPANFFDLILGNQSWLKILKLVIEGNLGQENAVLKQFKHL